MYTRMAAGLSMLALGLALGLSGCASQPLSGREIARAVFFGCSQGQSTALLVLADNEAKEGETGYKTVLGKGATPARALQDAADGLQGRVFYGLMDVAGLPPKADWEQATEIGTLLYDQAKPTPELALCLLRGDESEENAGQVYDELLAMYRRARLHCGLQQLFEQKDCCALPARTGGGYAMALLTRGRATCLFPQQLDACLAAALCGYTDRMDCPCADGEAYCRARVEVRIGAGKEQTTVRLCLKDAHITPLGPHVDGEVQARAALRSGLLAAFHRLEEAAAGQQSDPFRLLFWAAVRNGPQAAPPAPRLEVCFE